MRAVTLQGPSCGLIPSLEDQERLTFVIPEQGSKEKEHFITMVSLHIGWLGVFEEVRPMLELVEVDCATGTWECGQAVTL